MTCEVQYNEDDDTTNEFLSGAEKIISASHARYY